jgi:carbon monoxide dehydrogenase subunit G
MTKIESKKVSVPASASDVYTFLTNTDNIEKLLPKDKISSWTSDGKSCSFKVQSAYQIGLELTENTPNTNVRYKSTPGTPFPFNLNVVLNETDGKTEAQLLCDAEINMFLEMMVKGPLKNLFDYMADKLTTQFVTV